MFSTLYPEINMLNEISKHFRFMETHVVRNHVNFQINLISPKLCKPNVIFNMYWSYAKQQKWSKVILTKKSY